jgi:predicted HTH transcriptional regulator
VALKTSEKKVLDAIMENPYISINELVTNTELSRRTVSRAIAKLKRMGILVRTGDTSSGHWETLG